MPGMIRNHLIRDPYIPDPPDDELITGPISDGYPNGYGYRWDFVPWPEDLPRKSTLEIQWFLNGRFYFMESTYNRIWSTADFVTWTSNQSNLGTLLSGASGQPPANTAAGGGILFCSRANDGTSWTSTNYGVTWVRTNAITGTTHETTKKPLQPVYGQNRFVCRNNGFYLMYSTDGRTWTPCPGSTSYEYCIGPGAVNANGRIVFCGYIGSSMSTDGITFSERNIAWSAGANRPICLATKGNLFVTFSEASPTRPQELWTSPIGTAWTKRNHPDANLIVFSLLQHEGIFCAMTQDRQSYLVSNGLVSETGLAWYKTRVYTRKGFLLNSGNGIIVAYARQESGAPHRGYYITRKEWV